MIQLRWLVRPTGRTIMDDHGYYQPETERVLQFRQEYNATVYAGNPSDEFKHQTRQMVWSTWTDVPVAMLEEKPVQEIPVVDDGNDEPVLYDGEDFTETDQGTPNDHS